MRFVSTSIPNIYAIVYTVTLWNLNYGKRKAQLWTTHHDVKCTCVQKPVHSELVLGGSLNWGWYRRSRQCHWCFPLVGSPGSKERRAPLLETPARAKKMHKDREEEEEEETSGRLGMVSPYTDDQRGVRCFHWIFVKSWIHKLTYMSQ